MSFRLTFWRQTPPPPQPKSAEEELAIVKAEGVRQRRNWNVIMAVVMTFNVLITIVFFVILFRYGLP